MDELLGCTAPDVPDLSLSPGIRVEVATPRARLRCSVKRAVLCTRRGPVPFDTPLYVYAGGRAMLREANRVMVVLRRRGWSVCQLRVDCSNENAVDILWEDVA